MMVSAKPIPHFDWVAYHAERTPDKVAMVDLATGRQVTYERANDRASRLASLLRSQGMMKGDRIAILARNCPHFFDLQFACGKLGTITLPLNWRLQVPELSYIVGDAAPRVLLYDKAFRGVAAELAALGPIEHLVELDPDDPADEYATMLARHSADLLPEPLTLDDVVTIMYTSGTTGRPKGVLVTHQMLLFNNLIATTAAKVTADSTFLALLPLFHIGGLNVYSNPTLHAGGTVAIARDVDPSRCLELLTDRALGVTHCFAVPTIYQEIASLPAFGQADFSRLVTAGVGAAPCPAPLLRRWEGRGVVLRDSYGMTETGAPILVAEPRHGAAKANSVGRPVLYSQVRVVDDHGRDVPRGAVGELWLRGPTITPGYWGNSAATDAAFTNGWFRTGDAARVDDEGDFSIVDRTKDMYISGGENVYPAEVERVIFELAGVHECAVVGLLDQRWGEVGAAFVVLDNTAVTADDVLAHCRANLASFKVPAAVHFLDNLPRTATGKLLKRTLREQVTILNGSRQ